MDKAASNGTIAAHSTSRTIATRSQWVHVLCELLEVWKRVLRRFPLVAEERVLNQHWIAQLYDCLLYTSPSPRDS